KTGHIGRSVSTWLSISAATPNPGAPATGVARRTRRLGSRDRIRGRQNRARRRATPGGALPPAEMHPASPRRRRGGPAAGPPAPPAADPLVSPSGEGSQPGPPPPAISTT